MTSVRSSANWRGRLAVIGALAAVIAGALVAACSSSSRDMPRSEAPAGSRLSQAAVPPGSGWTPSGFSQDSLGMSGMQSRRQALLGDSPSLGGWSTYRWSTGGLKGVDFGGAYPNVPTVDLDSVPRARAASPRPMFRANEEVWVIEKVATTGPGGMPPPPDDGTPRSGCLMTRIPGDDGQTRDVPVPLRHTDVQAWVSGFISTVDVTQQFHNPFSSKIEALYVFPLPDNAAVSEFVMTVGDRHIRGIIRERAEAERVYDEARAAGHVASLLTQERPNIFTQHVANIEPGKAIDIAIRYYGTLPYNDGAYEFAFPMVVGPRFNPPGTSDGVGEVPRGRAGASGQRTEVQYLRPGERSGHDISIRVAVEAGVSIEAIASNSHKIDIERPGASAAVVTLSKFDAIPNRDFVLRIGVAGEKVKSTLITRADPGGTGGYFALMLVPPKDLASLKRGPVEMIFVVDSSGSMDGRPMQQAKAAVERGLKSLQPGDSFQLINFSNTASQLGPSPLEATPANVRRGLDYLSTVDAGGGTMMINGLRASLDYPHDAERLRFVAFLTDAFIGNESEIIRELHGRLGATRVFSFGIGTSVNRSLIESMARVGTGVAAYVGLADSSEEIMDAFFERVSHPAMSDLSIEWGGVRVSDVTPSRLPDLFVGRPVVLTGRYQGEWSGTVRVSGRAGGRRQQIDVPADSTATGAQARALPQVWARMRIGELADRTTWDSDPRLPWEVRRVALDYGLMSSFTAFVAVDSLSRTRGTYGTTVAVPVPVPEGVRYETTVPESR